ncbi:hypothetical protein REPUB_Repub14bG0098000 [Reevesia pubescens]
MVYNQAQCSSHLADTMNIASWLPPHSDVLKVNFDASFQSQNNECGFGIVIRNYAGLIMGVGAFKKSNVNSIFMAETLTARQALMLTL